MTTLRDEVDEALGLVNAPDSTNDGGPASIADEVRTLLSIQRVLLQNYFEATKQLFVLREAVLGSACVCNDGLCPECERLRQLAEAATPWAEA